MKSPNLFLLHSTGIKMGYVMLESIGEPEHVEGCRNLFVH